MTSLPLVEPEDLPPSDRKASDPLIGVVLAAGTSDRFEAGNKLLVELDGEPIVSRATRSLVESSLDSTTVIVGHQADAVAAGLQDLEVDIRTNPDYDRGMGTSVRRGVEAAVAADAAGVLIALGDMPWIDPATIDLLISAFHGDVAEIIAAGYRSQRGNPVIFDERWFDRLRSLPDDSGARTITLNSGHAVCLETDDPGVVRDIDRRNDLARFGKG